MKITKLRTETTKLDSPHIIYLIELSNETDSFIKIGVTTSLEKRLSYIHGYNIKITKTIACNGYQARAFESILLERVLNHFEKYIFKKGVKFNGYTECYNSTYLPQIEKAFKSIENKINKIEKNNLPETEEPLPAKDRSGEIRVKTIMTIMKLQRKLNIEQEGNEGRNKAVWDELDNFLQNPLQ